MGHETGKPPGMHEERAGITRSDAVMGGRLLALAHENGYSELTEEVAGLVSSAGTGTPPRTNPPLYGGVLRWTVTTIADVVVDKMGAQVRGDESFELTIRTESGRHVRPEELPQPESTVMKAVIDSLSGNVTEARADLDQVVFAMDWASQMEALVEAVLWLDRLLDTPGPQQEDAPPW
ncbi:hypothetical protein OED52_09485 [Rhodococcus sp. Z13]|uniref:Uncharacterized protein n=1 Tax=Rhodococcus sacchari TaxID=2962047 RepID=A0ACD4DKZ8_9NOCA|nr:hypothetical protein [Rhodococcus sp. Z13]UYP20720.1 hypothetical protein OED52_09485 [Rhodococcus sp. Z13]